MGEISQKVGKKIKQIREARNMKQCVLAEILGMEPSNLTRIESGMQFPKEENLVKIAHALDVEIKDLFDFMPNISKSELLDKIVIMLEEMKYSDVQFLYNIILQYSIKS